MSTLSNQLNYIKPSYYVGVGASAGGLEALEQFFANMPSNTNMAFIVIQHLSPDYKSMMVELLQRHTQMEVLRSEENMLVEANKVYLIPPKNNLTIQDGILHLTAQDSIRGLNLPIDIFFRALAADQKKQAIGIVLSGTGSDGSLGIRAIKEVGGMVMAQDSNSAKFDGMPKSAVATTVVDYVLQADKMSKELVKYTQHPYMSRTNETNLNQIASDSALSDILDILRGHLGIDFHQYKPNTILRRLERRISINQIPGFEQYRDFLSQSPHEIRILYKELLIGVTQFFRDEEAWEIIAKDAIPGIFSKKKTGSSIRVWTVACSTGEEAYSMAILFKEYMDKNEITADIKIFATDLDKEAIEFSSVGFYPESIVSDVNPNRLSNYFTKNESGGFQINENIRRMVIFAPHNIIKDPPFSKIDMISCRNLLIYLKPQMQRKILSMFHFSLKMGGYLFLGSSETVGDLSDVFNPINSKWKIYAYSSNSRNPSLSQLIVPTMRSENNKPANYQVPVPSTTRNKLMDSVYEAILNTKLPPGVLVDESFNIIQIFRNVNRYIALPQGKVSWNLLKMIRPDLSMILSSVLHTVLKDRENVIYKDIALSEKEGSLAENETPNQEDTDQNNIKAKNSQKEYLTISAQRILVGKFKNSYILVSFEQQTKDIPPSNEAENEINFNQQYHERMMELEKEVQIREESLQTTLEEMETSNEELQATNEELIASNEELQSTNEELQSVNEELYTVNTEYHQKIEELTALNSDIHNLLKNTNIGTLFLDKNMRIRKFTQRINNILNIMDIDIGRPISHISFNVVYDNFLDDIDSVVNTLQPKELEIKDINENWHLLKIMPYRTGDNAVDGIIITLIEINKLKKAQEELKRERDFSYRLLNNSPIGKIMTDVKGNILYINKKAKEMLDIEEQSLDMVFFHQGGFKITYPDGRLVPKNKMPFKYVDRLADNAKTTNYILQKEGDEHRYLNITVAPIYDENREITGAVYSLIDNTTEKESKNRENNRTELLAGLGELISDGIVLINSDMVVLQANNRATTDFNLLSGTIMFKDNGLKWFDDKQRELSVNENPIVEMFKNQIADKQTDIEIVKDNLRHKYSLKVKLIQSKGVGDRAIIKFSDIN